MGIDFHSASFVLLLVNAHVENAPATQPSIADILQMIGPFSYMFLSHGNGQ